jgi:hypothetical protein
MELNSRIIFGSKKSEILMFRASKHESTFQKTRFDIFLKKPKKKKKKKKKGQKI